MKNKTTILILCITVFLIITFFILNKFVFVINFDQAINNFMLAHQSPAISSFALSITNILNPIEAFIIFLIFGIFLIRKNRHYFYSFTISTALGTLLPLGLKFITQIPRPSLLLEQDFSFPSAHATIATIFLLSSIFFLMPLMKNGFSKNIFKIITYIIFPLVAFSRIYLSVHWTSDVLAGIVLGFICFIISEIICCHKKENVL